MIEKRSYDANASIREIFHSSYEGVKRLFARAYDNTGSDANLVVFSKNISFQE